MRTYLSVALGLGILGCAAEPPPREAPKEEQVPATAPAEVGEKLHTVFREKVHADFRNIEMAARLFHLDHGRLPRSIRELTEPSKDGSGSQIGPYLEVKGGVPLDPWGHEYICEARDDEIHILSLGPDGEPGGGDDISNQ